MINYELRLDQTELNFRAVEELDRITENKQIYYRIRFSYMFLGDNKLFNHCFGSN